MPNGIGGPYQDLYTTAYNAQAQGLGAPNLEMYVDPTGRISYRIAGMERGPKVVSPQISRAGGPSPSPGPGTQPAPGAAPGPTGTPTGQIPTTDNRDMGNPPGERTAGMSTQEQIAEITRRNTALNPSLRTSIGIGAGVLQGGLGLAVSQAIKAALGKETYFDQVPSFTAEEMAAINARAAELVSQGVPVQVAASSAISEARSGVSADRLATERMTNVAAGGMLSGAQKQAAQYGAGTTPSMGPGLGTPAPNPPAVEGPFGLSPVVGPPRTGMVTPTSGYLQSGPVKAPSTPKDTAARAAADRVSERSTRTTQGAARTAGGEKGPASRGTAAPGPAGAERKGGGEGGRGGAAGGQGSKGGSSRGARGE